MRLLSRISALFMCVMLAGCDITPANVIAGINAIVPVAIDSALVREAQTSPTTANAVAQTISTVVKADAIPLVNGNLKAGVLFMQLQTLIESKVGPGWGTTVASVLGTVFGNIDLHAPQMSDTEKSYVLAGLNALANGCDLFLAGKVAMLDGSNMDKAELMACLKSASPVTRANDATPDFVIPAPEYSLPQSYSTCANGQCHRSTCSGGQCSRAAGNYSETPNSSWDSEGDGHGQGAYK